MVRKTISKCFIFETNIREDCKFKEALGPKAARDMHDLLTRAQPYDLLTRAQPYIDYEEKKITKEAEQAVSQRKQQET